MSRVLVIGDTHFPATHPGYLRFCEDLADKHNCNKFVHIGDVTDWHAISLHDKEPEAKDALSEYELAKQHVDQWKKSFPEMLVCEGNHDARIARLAKTVNIPSRFLKGYNDLWETPDWLWRPDHKIDGVYYLHGTGTSGKYPAMTTMEKMLMSTVQGHVHAASGLWWKTNPERRLFGMNTGTGVDDRHISFRYGENLKTRAVLSAGIVIHGTPQHFIMPCGEGEKYHRSRFNKKGKRR
jgi:predicted phosphodiesterase